MAIIQLIDISIVALIIGVALIIMLDPSSYIEYLFLVLGLGLFIFSALAQRASRNPRLFHLISFILSVVIIFLGIFYFKLDSFYGLFAFVCAPPNAIESLLALVIKSKD